MRCLSVRECVYNNNITLLRTFNNVIIIIIVSHGLFQKTVRVKTRTGANLSRLARAVDNAPYIMRAEDATNTVCTRCTRGVYSDREK